MIASIGALQRLGRMLPSMFLWDEGLILCPLLAAPVDEGCDIIHSEGHKRNLGVVWERGGDFGVECEECEAGRNGLQRKMMGAGCRGGVQGV